jgi:hypothetical protein
MSLGASLGAVIAAFLAILVVVVFMAFRERRLGTAMAAGREAERASDSRVMVVIFTAIPGGMILTLVTAWLVFF